MIETAAYDTKPYDREYLVQAPGADRIAWRFYEFRLGPRTFCNRGGFGAEPFLAGTTL